MACNTYFACANFGGHISTWEVSSVHRSTKTKASQSLVGQNTSPIEQICPPTLTIWYSSNWSWAKYFLLYLPPFSKWPLSSSELLKDSLISTSSAGMEKYCKSFSMNSWVVLIHAWFIYIAIELMIMVNTKVNFWLECDGDGFVKILEFIEKHSNLRGWYCIPLKPKNILR